MFKLICMTCNNEIEIEEDRYRIKPTDNFSIFINDDYGDAIYIECNNCCQETIIK
ncbi:MAG TPA: hypothetical protein VIM70_06210 [Clostridium sp.]|uniref:hypothetical protein n=1 Tax=Clostridium sp. TaxID=1506 RepID=UPI002F95A5E2